MRITNDTFALANSAKNKVPYYVAEISWDFENKDKSYLTSHEVCETPYGESSVFRNTLKDIGSTSQKLDPIQALSTIGTLNFNAIDTKFTELLNQKLKTITTYGSGYIHFSGNAISGFDSSKHINKKFITVSNTINNNGIYEIVEITPNGLLVKETFVTELNTSAIINASADILRRRRVRIYVGYKGLAWSNYLLVKTQLIDELIVHPTYYEFKCSDIQRSQRSEIFDLNKTVLTKRILPSISRATISANSANNEYIVPDSIVNDYSVNDKVYFSGFLTPDNNGFKTIAQKTNAGFIVSEALVTEAAGQYVTITQATVEVVDTSLFELLEHGSSYSDLPNVEAGYCIIDNMVFSYTSKTNTTFDNCILGSLNTRVEAVTLESGNEDTEIEVKEFVYLQMPTIKLLYAILTGNLVGAQPTPGKKLPSNWHLGIDSSLVSLGHFEDIGSDIWNTTNDNIGLQCRFLGEEKQDAKSFIEKELGLLSGVFNPVLSSGELAVKRMSIVQKDTPPVAYLNSNNIISHSPLTIAMKNVYNNVVLEWDWDYIEKKFTRFDPRIDDTSISINGKAPKLTLKFRGMSGYSATDVDIANRIDNAIDRYAGPPLLISIQGTPETNNIEVGDIVSVDLPNVSDFFNDNLSLKRSFEVQEVNIDWRTGRPTFKLFGSSQKPSFYSLSQLTSELDPSYYTSEGVQINATSFPGKYTYQLLTGAILFGKDDVTDNNSIFYHEGDLTLHNCTLFKNVQLRVNGILTYTGTLDGVGKGHPGLQAPNIIYNTEGDTNRYTTLNNKGISGGFGTTQAQGGLIATVQLKDPDGALEQKQIKRVPDTPAAINTPRATLFDSDGNEITNPGGSVLDKIYIKNNLTSIEGLPTDLQGSSGGVGGQLVYKLELYIPAPYNPEFFIPKQNTTPQYGDIRYSIGGDGGASGAGLVIIAKGVVPTGVLNISGASGSQGKFGVWVRDSDGKSFTAPSVRSGAGAGGSSGALLVLIDGNSSLIPRFDSNNLITKRGDTPNTWFSDAGSYYNNISSEFIGLGEQDLDASLVYTIPPSKVPVPNTLPIAELPSSIILTESASELGFQASGFHIVNIQATVAPPSGVSNYSYSKLTLYINGKKSGAPLIADPTTIFRLPANGDVITIRASSVSNKGIESPDYVSESITLSVITQAVLDNVNSIVSSTGLGGPNAGFSLDSTGIKAFAPNNPSPLMVVDATTGVTRLYGENDQLLLESGILTIVPPVVTGLQCINGVESVGNRFEFVGKDVQISWRQSISGIVELTDDTVGDEHADDWWFKDYIILIYDNNGVLLKEHNTVDTFYTYKYEENLESNIDRIPNRELIISVYAESIYKNQSPRPAKIYVSNPTISNLPSALSVIGGYNSINVQMTAPIDPDYSFCEVHISTSQGFTPSSATLLDTLTERIINKQYLSDETGTRLLNATTYFIIFRFFDDFGINKYLQSSGFSVTTNTSAIDVYNGLSAWATRVAPADLSFITNNLAAEAVTSSKIVSLTAAKLTAGVVDVTIQLNVGVDNPGRITVAGNGNERLTIGTHTVNSIERIVSFGDGSNTENNYALLIDANGSATFKGALSAATGTFAGSLSAATGTFIGSLLVGSSGYTNLADKPNSLFNINTAEGDKLTSIANNADVTQTIIDGGTITSGRISLNGFNSYIKSGQTDYATGDGWWLGKELGIPKFSIGNDYEWLKYDENGLSISGTIGITPSISVNPYIAIGTGLYNDTLTNGTFFVGKVAWNGDIQMSIGSVPDGYSLLFDGKHVDIGQNTKIIGVDSFRSASTIINNRCTSLVGLDIVGTVTSVTNDRIRLSTNSGQTASFSEWHYYDEEPIYGILGRIYIEPNSTWFGDAGVKYVNKSATGSEIGIRIGGGGTANRGIYAVHGAEVINLNQLITLDVATAIEFFYSFTENLFTVKIGSAASIIVTPSGAYLSTLGSYVSNEAVLCSLSGNTSGTVTANIYNFKMSII